jgi:UDP-glucuronate 4-epimerase
VTILVTGSAGFIGYHVCQKLLAGGHKVVGIDNISTYYDTNLKMRRHAELSRHLDFIPVVGDIRDASFLNQYFEIFKPSTVIHLAAQAGVRHSLTHPEDYIQTNIVGTFNILEMCTRHGVDKLLYASSSSVYGKCYPPFHEEMDVSLPMNLYAATKKSCELMVESYCEMKNLRALGLRFFTVYGPWGRPDMALFKFAENMMQRLPIQLYNNGKHSRSFTYVSDVADAVEVLHHHFDRLTYQERHAIFNIGNPERTTLEDYVKLLAKELDEKPIIEYLPLQKGDIVDAQADISKIQMHTGWAPIVSVEQGISRFVSWYKTYYGWR